MPIQITGSWNLTGSFTASAGFQGTASYATYALSASYAPGGGGAAFPYTGAAEISGSLAINNIPVQFTNPGSSIYIVPNFTITPTASVLNTVHISQSGIYNIDLVNMTQGVSCSLNVYYWIDLLPMNSETQILLTVPSGTLQAIAYRTLVTASNSTEYWAVGVPGINTGTFNRIAGFPVRRYIGAISGCTHQVVKSAYGTYLGKNSTVISGEETAYLFLTGSQGTPL